MVVYGIQPSSSESPVGMAKFQKGAVSKNLPRRTGGATTAGVLDQAGNVPAS
jgi:hypothetical protein